MFLIPGLWNKGCEWSKPNFPFQRFAEFGEPIGNESTGCSNEKGLKASSHIQSSLFQILEYEAHAQYLQYFLTCVGTNCNG
jgi:hypothetical protein